MKLIASLLTLLTLLTFVPLYLSDTCTNDGVSDINLRFLGSSFANCLTLTSDECADGLPDLGISCSALYVDLANATGVNNFLGSGRCACIDKIVGSLVILIDINPTVLTDVLFNLYILNLLNSFYYSVTSNRLPGSLLNITHIFMYGDSYIELNVLDILSLDLSLNSLIGLISDLLDGSTMPCLALNHALDILNEPTSLTDAVNYLFYWGFSTPDLTSCVTEGRSFVNTEVYALRQTLDVDLSGIEDLFGDFTSCNWYQSALSGILDVDDVLQVDLIIGSLADFLCASSSTSSTTTTSSSSSSTTTTTTPSPTTSLLGGLGGLLGGL